VPNRRQLAGALAVVVSYLAIALAGPTPTADALSCAEPEPPPLSTREMTLQGRTGVSGHPYLVLGRIRAIRDVRGAPDEGRAIARVVVRASPTLVTAGSVRIRFSDYGLGSAPAGFDQYERGERWAFVLSKHEDGMFTDDRPCGQTWSPWPEKFRNLIRLSRRV
jgi:hypothetical protein